jgi:phosphoserine phosphatase
MQKSEFDIVISASPDFLLRPVVTEIIGIRLIASNVDCKTGRFHGRNCKGCENVTRFKEMFGEDQIDAFYGDSSSDFAMVKISKRAYRVKGYNIQPWE